MENLLFSAENISFEDFDKKDLEILSCFVVFLNHHYNEISELSVFDIFKQGYFYSDVFLKSNSHGE